MSRKNQQTNSIMSAIEISPDLSDLHAYSSNKLTLAKQLYVLREVLTNSKQKIAAQQIADIIVKLAEDRFTLAVLGQFKRGKSSLMNAIIGREILPTGILPLTSAITVLKYGPAERLIIHYENSIFPDEIPLSAIAKYVTEKENPGNIKKVKTAYVELPIPFLRRGLEFADTPGVGSVNTANTLTTYNFLPHCDAVFFVTSADAPLTDIELIFLHKISKYIKKIFFIVNKIDLITVKERNSLLEFITSAIKSHTTEQQINIFPVSAKLGMQAKSTKNLPLYEQSGLKALEETLAVFLAKEKSTLFLTRIIQQVLQILHKQTDQESVFQTASLFPQHDSAAINKLKIAENELKNLYEQLTIGINDTFVDYKHISNAVLSQSPPTVITKFIPSSIDNIDWQTDNCLVCDYLSQETLNFFTDWQYKLTIDTKAQNEFATEVGFCPLHTWQLLSFSSSFGASAGYTQLAEQIASRLQKISAVTTFKDSMAHLSTDIKNCRVCKLQRQSELAYIEQLSAVLSTSIGQKQYYYSQGVCLHHLSMLINITSNELAGFLLSHAAHRFAETAEDMQNYTLKHEAIRRALQNKNEKTAYKRLIPHLMGNEKLYLP